jgi:hypothetical protein
MLMVSASLGWLASRRHGRRISRCRRSLQRPPVPWACSPGGEHAFFDELRENRHSCFGRQPDLFDNGWRAGGGIRVDIAPSRRWRSHSECRAERAVRTPGALIHAVPCESPEPHRHHAKPQQLLGSFIRHAPLLRGSLEEAGPTQD